MFVPIPVLIVLGLVMMGLAAALLLSRRGDRGHDLMRPPAPPLHRAPPQPAAAFAASEGEAPEALTAEIRLLLERGRKIEAIKLLRDHQPGMGLKEAKDWVERADAAR